MALTKPRQTLAFDLDGIFVDAPPFVPKKILEWLFRGWRCSENKLNYRFPHTKFEQRVRKISHFYLFRPPIKKNIAILRQLARSNRYRLVLISSRYSFIHPETEIWLKKKGIKHLFKEIVLNKLDQQPHLFKKQQLAKIRPAYYFEDDEEIIHYLQNTTLPVKIIPVRQKKLLLSGRESGNSPT